MFAPLMPGGPEARLVILIFHRVHAAPDALFPGEVDAIAFDRICAWVGRWFNVLPLPEAVDRLRTGNLPRAAMAITFDDGYADNHDVALPILRRHGLPATIFVASGHLDGGRMWNDTVVEAVRLNVTQSLDLRSVEGLGSEFATDSLESRRASMHALLAALKYLPAARRAELAQAIGQAAGVPLPDDLMLTEAKVRALADADITIGAHTVTHPILARLADDQVRWEVEESRRRLQSVTGRPVKLFAYPNGKLGDDFGPREAALVKEAGFVAAFTTVAGLATRQSDAYQLPRFTPWRRSRTGFAWQLAATMAKR